MTDTLVQIDHLKTYFHTEDGVVKAVDDISLHFDAGTTMGIVGESGSGKSVTSLTIMQLLTKSAHIETGSISFLGRDLVKLPEPEMRKIRGKDIGMIFQEPMTSLNPVFTVGSQVMEAIMLHQKVTKAQARQRTIELFDEVGIPDPETRVNSYPHQMSGGQKQRVMIAMALSCNPKLLIADEPTTALDVTIQAQILDILRKLRDERGMAVLFITHDLGVIADIADHVTVMYRGKIVEQGDVVSIFENPQHPYTKGLLACRPRLDTKYKLLPTVDDFMEVKTEGDELKIIEKFVDEKRLNELMTTGRGRLLHPKSELAAMGHPWEEGHHADDAKMVADGEKPLLKVSNLHVHFPIRKGLFRGVAGHVKAVDGISFNVYRGQTLGLVGESGCGKTTTGRAIIQLIRPTSGEMLFDGIDLAKLNPSPSVFDLWPPSLLDHWRKAGQLRRLRRRFQIIFQDPYGSLNPRMTVQAAICEPMVIQRIGKLKERRDRAVALLEEVGLNASHLRRYPHEFSGGQRQRICIARALAVEPEFLICDESVSALDVSVQAQVLNLLKDLQLRRGLTYLFISHDLSVVKFMSDMIAVMNQGKIVEFGPADNIYANPQQEYTKRLISATPQDDLDHIRRRQAERKTALAARLSAV